MVVSVLVMLESNVEDFTAGELETGHFVVPVAPDITDIAGDLSALTAVIGVPVNARTRLGATRTI